LPDDVLVLSADVVRDDFDPIGDCVSKGYAYRLHVSPTRPLWDRRYVQQVWQPVDMERMNEAASRIVGEHDFAAFAAAGHGRVSTVRTVHSCKVVREGGSDEATEQRSDEGEARDNETERWRDEAEWAGPLRIEVSGNGFLYNMVRIIAGTLVEVGRGKMSVDDVMRALQSGDRRLAGPTMPAQGLCLEWVEYGASAEEPTAGRQSAKHQRPGNADSASWFESYSNLLDKFSEHLPTGEGPFACPCCRKVTLTERGSYEICSECGWEDDGQDDPYADLITGGPNGRLSLTQARELYQKRQHRLKRPHPPDRPDTTA
jgi:tRNA pseudouridine(38-40) synthase